MCELRFRGRVKRIFIELTLGVCLFVVPLAAEETEQISSGSGFFVSKKGHLITNEHVVANAEEIWVTLADGTSKAARVLLANPTKDLAVLKIDGVETEALRLGDSSRVDVLDRVVVFGFPLAGNLGRELSAYSGTINAWRNLDQLPLLQMDAQVNAGASGGPVVTEDGVVIGITVGQLNALVFLLESGNMIEGVKFAIPVDEIKSILKGLSIPLVVSTAQKARIANLFETVRPAMAYVEVKLKPDIEAAGLVGGDETTASSAAEGNIRAFIGKFVKAGEAETVDEVLPYYSDPVDYYDEGYKNLSHVRMDVDQYFRRWPKRSYDLISEPLEIRVDGTVRLFSYDVLFDVSNDTKRIEGVARVFVGVEAAGRLKIVAIREKILKRRKTSIEK